ncbi:MAG: T9SS type A sorting domain-containing protein, partial [Bacteroidales bacterium]|nr:T9SS type A sorting domain-containing protein [Bacteroidales bacterium]
IVKVNKATTATFSKSTGSSKSRANRDYIAFTVANNQYEDVAYAMFSNGLGLDKINHRNADIPMVYIPQNGQNYAIATMDDNTQAFELNFKAMTTGQYTLSYKAEGKYSYLHVIDRLTGEDIDMLLDGEYSFIGSPRDNEARFIVKLSYNANIDEIEVNDNFAYQNGSDIIVNGNGELQVFDVTGRMVMNTKINGIQTVNVPATGMYIFRMVGESVQTQKIVVR